MDVLPCLGVEVSYFTNPDEFAFPQLDFEDKIRTVWWQSAQIAVL